MTLMNISFEPQVTAEEFCAKTNIRLTGKKLTTILAQY